MPQPIDLLDAPIDWRDPLLWPILSDLQGNILKGHGRDHTRNIFLGFDPDRVADVRKAIRSVAANVTSALTQLRETSVFKIMGRPGGTAVYLAISAAGYRAIGLTPPGNPAFLDGMAARAADLHDPDAAQWEGHLRAIHAVLIVADDSEALAVDAASFLTAGLTQAGITVLGRDAGRALCRPPGTGEGEGDEPVGHPGWQAQPLLLAEDVAAERAKARPFLWDPGFSPREAALVRDPHGGFGDSFGSYLVYRKLEQAVGGFPLHEAALADALGLVGKDWGCVGAIGRSAGGASRSGTGVARQDPADDGDDPAGLRCAFPLHLRHADPCGETRLRLGASTASQRSRLMPRRGIPYGDRADRRALAGSAPGSGAGLLFMAYNADIARQFEYAQKAWAATPACAHDALGSAGPPSSRKPDCDCPPANPIRFAFSDLVTMKGGEYLFAPSLSALAAL